MGRPRDSIPENDDNSDIRHRHQNMINDHDGNADDNDNDPHNNDIDHNNDNDHAHDDYHRNIRASSSDGADNSPDGNGADKTVILSLSF